MPHPNVIESEDQIERIVRAMRVVAVVGMKDDPSSPAFTVPGSMQAKGIRILPVNPKLAGRVVLGERAYATLGEVPERFDLVDVFRRPEFVPAHADQVIALPPDRRPRVFWMQTGIVHEGAAARLADAGVQVVMDRCLGVYASRVLRGPPTRTAS
jgi:uncharacterized protein